MSKEYQHKFQAFEDRTETEAFLLWRRFFRLRKFDVLSLDFLLMPEQIANSEEIEDEDAKKGLEKPVYCGFLAKEFGVIQLGKLVALDVGGLDRAQEVRYRLLRDFYLGGLYLLIDYIEASQGHGQYSIEEIFNVAGEKGRFSDEFFPTELQFVDFLFASLRREKKPRLSQTRAEQDFQMPDNMDEFLKRKRSLLPEILTLKSLEQIDRYILDRI